MARYRKIDVRVWNDGKFRSLSAPPPNAQTLWLYLLTNPDTTSIPGLFCAGEAALSEALRWPLAGFRKAFVELMEKGMVKASWQDRVVWIPNAIRYNPPESPNVVLAWAKAWDNVPECPLRAEALEHLRRFVQTLRPAFLKAFTEGFAEAFPEAFQEDSSQPSPNQNQEPEPEPEQEPPPPTSSAEPAAVLAEVVVEVVQEFRHGHPFSTTRQWIRWKPTLEGLWDFIQLNRELHGFPREKGKPRGWVAWGTAALLDPGPEGIERTHAAYLEDQTIRAAGHPTAVFVSSGVWDARRPAPVFQAFEAPA